MINKSLFSSNSDLWATPLDFFKQLDDEFHFTLDPCASPDNAKCSYYFTKKQNGLIQDWSGHRVFMNPPYGRSISAWVSKACLSSALVVCLLPARTDTKWFHNFILNKAEIRFIPGRLKFGSSANSAPFPSMVVIFNNL